MVERAISWLHAFFMCMYTPYYLLIAKGPAIINIFSFMSENQKSKDIPQLELAEQFGMFDNEEGEFTIRLRNTGCAVWLDEVKPSKGEVITPFPTYLTGETEMIRFKDYLTDDEEERWKVELSMHNVNEEHFWYEIGYKDEGGLCILDGGRRPK